MLPWETLLRRRLGRPRWSRCAATARPTECHMARVSLRLAKNVRGDVYVDETCIDCDTCRRLAPETFARWARGLSYGVHDCGFATESSFGATSYLVVREGGNVLVDSPRAARPLVQRIEQLGGLGWMFLTHRDDVADHRRWRARLRWLRVLPRPHRGREPT